MIRALSLLLAFLLTAPMASAKMAPPRPPTMNPHAPKTQADKARVALAKKAVKLFLQGNLHARFKNLPAKHRYQFTNKTSACLDRASCYTKDLNLGSEVKTIQSTWGRVTRMVHAHIIPWSFKRFLKHRNHPHGTPHHGHKMKKKAKGRSWIKSMPAPKLKHDEYMVHAYVRFDKSYGWFHLDVIMSQDAKGRPVVRHFFVTRMVSKGLPPGVKC